MPTDIQKANLPLNPFDGQEFIDFRRMRWIFDGSTKCWKLSGTVADIPLATPAQSGLLSAKLKQLIDTIPERAGSFGIVAKPLLSVVPKGREALYKGVVEIAGSSPSGSQIRVRGAGSGSEAIFETNEWSGKLVFFTKGVLKNKHYLIFTNDGDILYIMGKDSASAQPGDTFEIVEPVAINDDGVIQGDIELVSESLDISCVDHKGEAVSFDGSCNVNQLFVDDPENPPGLDIKINETFLDQFCVSIPAHPGPVGDRGEVGDKGDDGHGDGPQGLKGATGLDAPAIGNKFTGIKFNDVDDIYDTAVVAMELDSPNGKLHVVKAKIRTPDSSRAADQIIASAVSRDVQFTDSDFTYNILMPNGDSIGIADVELMHYPQGFVPPQVQGENRPSTTEANVVKLSAVIDAMVSHYETKLEEASLNYDEQIKPFIESKDAEARSILNSLADEVAKCEWNMPIEFCLGISPQDCSPGEVNPTPFPLAESLLGPDFKNAVGVPLPPVQVPVTPRPPGEGSSPPPVPPGSAPLVPPGGSEPLREPSDPVPTGDDDSSTQYPSRPTYPEDSGAVITPRDGLFGPGSGAARARRRGSSQPSAVIPLEDVDGGTVLRPSGIVLLYGSGAARTRQSPYTASVTASYSDEGGNSGSVSIQDSDSAMLNNFDRDAFQVAQSASSDLETAAAFRLDAPGEAELILEIEGDDPEGTVTIYPIQVFNEATMSGAPIPVTQTIARAPDGSQGMVSNAVVSGGGEVDCPDCPDCGDVDVDCGDVDCPECPPVVTIASISPSSGSAGGGVPVTITGSGFGSIPGVVYFGGIPATLDTWSPTSISVITGPTGAGDLDVVVEDASSNTDTAPNGYIAT
jgi:hypothetical protein